MYKIDGPGVVNAMPARTAVGTVGWFNQSPGASPGTVVTAEWLNMLQAEILSVLASAALAPNKADDAQLLRALQLFRGVEIFTASGNHTVRPGIVHELALVWGGGGSGGVSGPSRGGAGGGLAIKACTVVPAAVIAVTIGAGGGPSGVVAGGTSSFGAFCSATGGAGLGGPGGIGIGGDVNLGGAEGGRDSGGTFYGIGGGAPFGGAGSGLDTVGGFPGGGGGASPDASSGTGGGGCVIVIW